MKSDYPHDGTVEGMAKAIHEYIKDMGSGVSFVEVEHNIDGFEDREGNMLCVAPNVLLWVMSPVAVQATVMLNTKRLVEFTPASPLIYMFDGRSLGLPVAKRIPKGGYKTPHWFPVALGTPESRQAIEKQFARKGAKS